MDRISELPDELLVKILSFLPTKVATSTSILSKRWEFLWMWMPKLEYDDKNYSMSECERLRSFLERNLPLHKAPVIESFHLRLSIGFKREDIKMWVLIAVSRFLRELVIYHSSKREESNILPSSLYISKTLVILKLKGRVLLDVPRMVCLPSLKTLQLEAVIYLSEESFRRLVSNSPVLEYLLVKLCYDGWENFTIITPSLQSLTLSIHDCEFDEFVIDTPSLKYFKIKGYNCQSNSCLVETMPNLREAYVDIDFLKTKSLIGSLTFVERLRICSAAVYGESFLFHQLKYLKLCISRQDSSALLVHLELDLYHKDDDVERLVYWHKPSFVPECVSSKLQVFNWLGYSGEPQENDLVIYILKNASCLKTATISCYNCNVLSLEMIEELLLFPRASATCRLEFD